MVVLIGLYLLWALAYGIYLLLRMVVWSIEKLELMFMHVITTNLGQPHTEGVLRTMKTNTSDESQDGQTKS